MRKLITTILAGTLALTMVAGVTAQSTEIGEANVCVQPQVGVGSINVFIGDSNFETVTYNADTAQLTEEDVVVTVTDTRGVVGGWNVTLSGENFSTSPSTITFDSESLVLTNTATVAAPPTGSFTSTGVAVPTTLTDPAANIITATNVGTSPAGGYIFTFADSDLTVPAGTLVGQYNSTLTVTITAGTDNGDACAPEEGSGAPIGIVRNV